MVAVEFGTMAPGFEMRQIRTHIERTEQRKDNTNAESVKNIFPLGWTLISLNESNCLPKKLLSSTVVLKGGLGFIAIIDAGKFPRPRVTNRRFPLNGPAPPFVICTMSERLS